MELSFALQLQMVALSHAEMRTFHAYIVPFRALSTTVVPPAFPIDVLFGACSPVLFLGYTVTLAKSCEDLFLGDHVGTCFHALQDVGVCMPPCAPVR